MDKINGAEKRRAPRLANYNLPLKFSLGDFSDNAFWVLRDISSTGIRMEQLIMQDKPSFQIDEALPLSLTLSDSEDVNCKAMISRVYFEKRGSNVVCGLGMEFDELQESEKEQLQLFVEERMEL